MRDGRLVPPAIEVKDVRFRYAPDAPEVLHGVSLRIQQGEFVALIGPNGAGKTTLAKHFNGLLRPTSGTVRVLGTDTGSASIAQLARLVGYVYQNPDHQIFAQRVRTEVAFGPRNLGLPAEEVEARVHRALELVGLLDHLDDYAFALGRGQRQKLAVASVLAMEPAVLVVDEPTTGLDQVGARAILDLLDRWNAAGRTIVAITHDMRLVAERIPRVIVVSEGRILGDGPTRDILSDEPLLRRAFLRPPQVTRIARALAAFGISPKTLTVDELYAQLVPLLRAERR
jgi:cobalt transport protein ATP-binding subunit